jgi:hypothetical protein
VLHRHPLFRGLRVVGHGALISQAGHAAQPATIDSPSVTLLRSGSSAGFEPAGVWGFTPIERGVEGSHEIECTTSRGAVVLVKDVYSV